MNSCTVMEQTCVQTHSHSRPKAILKADSQFIHLSIMSHEGPSPPAPGTIHQDTKSQPLVTTLTLHPFSVCLSLCLIYFFYSLHSCFSWLRCLFFSLPSLNSSPDSHSVYMSVRTNPLRRYSHAVTHRQTRYKPRYSTLK